MQFDKKVSQQLITPSESEGDITERTYLDEEFKDQHGQDIFDQESKELKFLNTIIQKHCQIGGRKHYQMIDEKLEEAGGVIGKNQEEDSSIHNHNRFKIRKSSFRLDDSNSSSILKKDSRLGKMMRRSSEFFGNDSSIKITDEKNLTQNEILESFKQKRKDNQTDWKIEKQKCQVCLGKTIAHVKQHNDFENQDEVQCSFCSLPSLQMQVLGYFRCEKCNLSSGSIAKIKGHQSPVKTLDSKKNYCFACFFSIFNVPKPGVFNMIDKKMNKSEQLVNKQMKIQLKNEIKGWFHCNGNHTIRRHPINIKGQWTCNGVKTKDDAFDQCFSHISDIKLGIEDLEKYQGYECTVCNWHICIGCLVLHLYLKEEKSKTQMNFENELIKMIDEETKQNQLMKFCENKIHECGDTEEQFNIIRDNEPKVVFNAMQRQFIRNTLYHPEDEKIQKIALKVFSYDPSNQDLLFLERDDENNLNPGNLFIIKKKEIQVIQKHDGHSFCILVKTIEQFAIPQRQGKNIIKTLRIYQFNQKSKEKFLKKQQIILEQVPIEDFDDCPISMNQITILDFKYCIFFWRRSSSGIHGDHQMQLWQYDIDKDILKQVPKIVIPCDNEKPFHLQFAFQIGTEKQYLDPNDFIEDQFVMKQPYFIDSNKIGKPKDDRRASKQTFRWQNFVNLHEQNYSNQPFQIMQIKDLDDKLFDVNNQESQLPITQFFVHNQKVKNKFEKTFTLFDTKIYSHKIKWDDHQVESLENTQNSSMLKDKTIRKMDLVIEGLPTIGKWLQGGHEIQYTDIKLPIFETGKKTVYYTLKNDKNGKNLVLIHPIIDESVSGAIMEKLLVKLQNKGELKQEGNRIMVIYGQHSKHKVMIKNINQDFLKIFNEIVSARMNGLDFNNLLTYNIDNNPDIIFVKQSFYSFLIGNPDSDPVNIEGFLYNKNHQSSINTVSEGESFKKLDDIDPSLNQFNEFIFNKEAQDLLQITFQKQETSLMKSTFYNRVYTSNNLLKANQEQFDLDIEELNDHQELEESLNTGEFTIDPAQHEKSIIWIEDPNNRKNIRKVKIASDIPPDRILQCIGYYYTHRWYFIMLVEMSKPGREFKHYFFVRLKLSDLKDNVRQNYIINYFTTPLYWISSLHKIELVQCLDIISSKEWIHDCDKDEIPQEDELYTLQCIGEKVIDQSVEQNFFPFFIIKIMKTSLDNPNVTDDGFIVNLDEAYFKILSVRDMEIPEEGNVKVSFNIHFIKDLSYKNLCFTKSSNLQQNIETNFIGAPSKVVQRCNFLLGILLGQQIQQIIIREYQVTFDIPYNKDGDTEVECLMMGKRVLISNTSMFQQFKFRKFVMIPIEIDHQKEHQQSSQSKEKHGIIGVHLILAGKKLRQKVCYIIPMISSGNYNNIYSYQSKIATFGSQKFWDNRNDTQKSYQYPAYFVLISVKIRMSLIKKCNIVQDEIKVLVDDLLNTQRKMFEFQFERILVNNFDDIVNSNFLDQREIFMASNCVDIYFNDLQGIEKAIQNKSNYSYDGSLLHSTIDHDMRRIKKYEELGELNKLLLICNDFNFDNQLTRAIRMNEFLVIKFLLEKIMEINSREYSKFIIQVLGEILNNDKEEINETVECILGFFGDHGQDLSLTINQCVLEKYISDKSLPMKLDVPIIFNPIYESFDEQAIEDTMSEKILQLYANIKLSDCHITIHHSYIDFGRVILGEKLRMNSEDYDGDGKFGELYFARLMVQDNVEFYSKPIVQKFIDYQFKRTFMFYFINIIIYVTNFFAPFLLIVFVSDAQICLNQYEFCLEVQNYCLISCLTVQIYFLLWEFVQMRTVGILNYFTNPSNLFDFCQFLNFIVIYIMKMHHNLYESRFTPTSNLQKMMRMLMTVQMFIKVLFHLKIYPYIGFMIGMLTETVSAMRYFAVLFGLLILFFTIIYKVLDIDFGNDYQLGNFIGLVIDTLRTTIGDDQIIASDSNTGDIINKLFWFTWLFHIVIMFIIMMNFIIALISDSYNEVNTQKQEYMYKEMASLNYECQQLLAILLPYQDLRYMTITSDKNHYQDTSNKQNNIAAMVQKSLQKLEKSQGQSIDGDFDSILLTVNHLSTNIQNNNHALEASQNQMVEINEQTQEELQIMSDSCMQITKNIVNLQRKQIEQEQFNAEISRKQDLILQTLMEIKQQNNKKCLYCNLEK